MPRYRAVLLLFGVLHLTACSTWQSVGPVSPSQFIEAAQPDRVRVTGGDVLEREVVSPSVEGDQLVGAGDFSVPLEDILRVEVWRFSVGRTVVWVAVGVGAYVAGFLAVMTLLSCETEPC